MLLNLENEFCKKEEENGRKGLVSLPKLGTEGIHMPAYAWLQIYEKKCVGSIAFTQAYTHVNTPTSQSAEPYPEGRATTPQAPHPQTQSAGPHVGAVPTHERRQQWAACPRSPPRTRGWVGDGTIRPHWWSWELCLCPGTFHVGLGHPKEPQDMEQRAG